MTTMMMMFVCSGPDNKQEVCVTSLKCVNMKDGIELEETHSLLDQALPSCLPFRKDVSSPTSEHCQKLSTRVKKWWKLQSNCSQVVLIEKSQPQKLQLSVPIFKVPGIISRIIRERLLRLFSSFPRSGRKLLAIIRQGKVSQKLCFARRCSQRKNGPRKLCFTWRMSSLRFSNGNFNCYQDAKTPRRATNISSQPKFENAKIASRFFKRQLIDWKKWKSINKVVTASLLVWPMDFNYDFKSKRYLRGPCRLGFGKCKSQPNIIDHTELLNERTQTNKIKFIN